MLEKIRSAFPALARVHRGFPVAYFDGPGGTQVPRLVMEAMSDYLFHHNANDGWSYPTSEETTLIVGEARASVAEFMNADAREIAFGQNMTSLTFHVSRAIGRGLSAGDEVIVTELDHHGNVDPWKQMARERGVVVKTARMIVETGRLDWEHLESLVGEKTKVLAIGAASNALGTINDIGRAAKLAHSVGAICYVDAVHYAPHHLIDVKAWDCDFLACSAYKFYGPHIGILYGKGEWLEKLDVPKLEPASNAYPNRIETGTQSFESEHGAAAAIEFLAGLKAGDSRRERLAVAYADLHAASGRLFERLWTGLQANPKVTVFGPPPGADRAPTVSFVVEGETAKEVAIRMVGKGVFVSHGNFYALSTVRRLGLEANGLVRVGLACYNTGEEVDRLLAEL